jgi:hypothetical protein
MDAALPVGVQPVLDAIRALDVEADMRPPEIWQKQVRHKLGRPENDQVTPRAIEWLADQGYIEPVETGSDQLPGPLTFRLSY